MVFDVTFFKYLGAAFISYAVIFFVALRIQNNSNSMKRALLSLFVGIGIIILNVIGILIDFKVYNVSKLTDLGAYLAFPMLAVLATIILPLIFFLMGKSRHQQLHNIHEEYRMKKIKEEKMQKPTVKDETEYLYLAFRYQGNFLLKEVKNRDDKSEFGGLVVKFHRNDYFHDEFIDKVIEAFELDVMDKKLAGTAIQKKDDKTNNKYYVYDVELNSITSKINDLVPVSPTVLYGYNMSNFNKQVLFHVVLRDYFEIEV